MKLVVLVMKESEIKAGWVFQLITFRPPGYPAAHVAIFITNSKQPNLQRLVYFRGLGNLKDLYPELLLKELRSVLTGLEHSLEAGSIDVDWMLLPAKWAALLVVNTPSGFEGPSQRNIQELTNRFLLRQ